MRRPKMFWIGLLVGALIGANLSLVFYAICVSSGRASEIECNQKR